MTKNNISVEEAGRQVNRSAFDDGMVDIFIASLLLMWAIAPYLSVYIGDFWSSAIFLPFWGVLFLVLYWIHKTWIRPRAGIVKYGPVRKKRMTAFTVIMLILNIAFLILGFVAFFMPAETGFTRILPITIMLVISFSLAGYFLDVPRFYAYGLLWAGGFFAGEWLYQNYGFAHHGYPVVFGTLSILILLVGVYKLITFIRRNPLPDEDPVAWEANNG